MIKFFLVLFLLVSNFLICNFHNLVSASCNSKNQSSILKDSSQKKCDDTLCFYSVHDVFKSYQLKKQIVIRVTIFLILIGLIRLLFKNIFDDFNMVPAMDIKHTLGFKNIHRPKIRVHKIMMCRNFFNGLNLFSCLIDTKRQRVLIILLRQSITRRFSSSTRNISCN